MQPTSTQQLAAEVCLNLSGYHAEKRRALMSIIAQYSSRPKLKIA
jgi:hypothetical protein